MNKLPVISVLMPVYNAEKFVAKTIESVLAQTMGDFRFYIYDDCSTDGSEDEILRYKDPRIVYKKLAKNGGYVPILNEMLNTCSSEMIARIDSDDICVENRFETQLSILRDNPKIGLCGSSATMISDDEILNGQVWVQPEKHADILFKALTENPVIHPSVMLRTEVVKKIGLYNPGFMPSEDLDYWLRASQFFELHNVRQPLIYYRHHSGQISNRLNQHQADNAEKIHQAFITGRLNCPEEKAKRLYNFLKGVEDLEGKTRNYFVRKAFLSRLPLHTKRLLIRSLLKKR